MECICKVQHDEKEGTGFLCKIPSLGENNLIYVLITNNHILNEKDIKNNKSITLIIYNKEQKKNIVKEIKIDESRIKYTYLNNEKHIDITIIEIKPDIDEINNFLEFDYEQLEIGDRKSIYILHYSENKRFISHGLITDTIEGKK